MVEGRQGAIRTVPPSSASEGPTRLLGALHRGAEMHPWEGGLSARVSTSQPAGSPGPGEGRASARAVPSGTRLSYVGAAGPQASLPVVGSAATLSLSRREAAFGSQTNAGPSYCGRKWFGFPWHMALHRGGDRLLPGDSSPDNPGLGLSAVPERQDAQEGRFHSKIPPREDILLVWKKDGDKP